MTKFSCAIFVATILALCVFSPASASHVTVKSSTELPCLSIPATQIEFPPDALARREGSTVVADLVFRGPDNPPEITNFRRKNENEFTTAVRKFVAGYRLTCMKPDDTPIEFRQTFTFNPYDARPVVNYAVEDGQDAEHLAQLSCLSHVDGLTKPEVPGEARVGTVDEGTFFYKVTFTAADKPPTVEFLAASDESILRAAVVRFAGGLRLPCLTKAPVSKKFIFSVHNIFGAPPIHFKDMTLQQFIAASRDFPKPIKLNLDSMDCPFDVQVKYLQPFDKNEIREYERIVPDRQPLRDWMSMITLNVGSSAGVKLLGDIFTVTVPCGSVDLQ